MEGRRASLSGWGWLIGFDNKTVTNSAYEEAGRRYPLSVKTQTQWEN